MSEEVGVQQSRLGWIFSSLGLWYTLILPAVALVCFVLTLLLVLRGRGPMAAAAIALIVPVPFLIGIAAALRGAMASFIVIASSSTPAKPSEIAVGISTALVVPLVSLFLMVPSYLVAVAGATIRALVSDGESSDTSDISLFDAFNRPWPAIVQSRTHGRIFLERFAEAFDDRLFSRLQDVESREGIYAYPEKNNQAEEPQAEPSPGSVGRAFQARKPAEQFP